MLHQDRASTYAPGLVRHVSGNPCRSSAVATRDATVRPLMDVPSTCTGLGLLMGYGLGFNQTERQQLIYTSNKKRQAPHEEFQTGNTNVTRTQGLDYGVTDYSRSCDHPSLTPIAGTREVESG